MGTYRISQLADRLHFIAASEHLGLPPARMHERATLDGAHRETPPDGAFVAGHFGERGTPC